MQFTDYQCFLCGKFLNKDNGTREHVIPRWLLGQFDLFDERLTLFNRTLIPYRQVTIPCCNECNSVYLSRIEAIMEAAIKRGADEVRKINLMTVYVWMGKIFYGLLYRDLSLLASRQDPNAGYLVEKEAMENFRALHSFLQAARMEIKFEGFFPGSIFIFDLDLPEGFPPFGYSDNPIGMTICLRMGNVGIIACLKDNGMIYEGLEELYNKTVNNRLLPVQFDELCAVVFYRAYSMTRTHKFISVSSPIQVPTIYRLPGFSLQPYFSDWDFPLLALFLAEFWKKYGLTYEEIYQPPQLMTFLRAFFE